MRKALLVGINSYPDNPLLAPINDAKTIGQLLSTSEDWHYNFQCDYLLGNGSIVTESRLNQELKVLFLQGSPEIALFYFAGHADPQLGGTLVAQNGVQGDLGVSIHNVLIMAGQSKAKHKIIILDCCFAGTAGSFGIFDDKDSLIPSGVIILAASGHDEKAIEIGGKGLFSKLLIDALQGENSDVLGNISIANLYSYADRYLGPWDQRPYFKANISELPVLRKARPDIDINILRKLPAYFSKVDEEYPVSPEYDNELPPPNLAKEAIFKDFRALFRSGLLVPVGEDFLYHAAKYSKSVKLTYKGQYYWKLAVAGKL